VDGEQRREAILAAKGEFAALPEDRREELSREFDETRKAARFHQKYRR